MAHTKAQKAVRGNRDSQSKRLGVKIYGGQKAKVGSVLIRQRGSKVWAGEGTMLSNDFTIISLKAGLVKFFKKNGKKFICVQSV